MLLTLFSKQFESSNIDTDGICICCTSKTEMLVDMKKCAHTGFLFNYNDIESKSHPQLYICQICHNMLKKIDRFKQQVEESVAIMNNQANVLAVRKITNLLRSDPAVTSYPTEIVVEIKEEYDFEPSDTEVKIENDMVETDLLVSKPKKLKQKVDKIYEGQIKVVVLSEEELVREREEMRKRDSYLKLLFKCESCIIGFDYEVTLERHNLEKHDKSKSQFYCHICDSVLGTKQSLYIHKSRHFKRFECVLCSRRFNQLLSATQHYDKTHALNVSSVQKEYSCHECGYSTTSHRIYRYHKEKHRKPQCELCGQCLATAGSLKLHMYTVHRKYRRLYQCSHCDKSYQAKSGLMSHTKNVHSQASSSAYCPKCKTHYKSEAVLAHHLRTHSNHVTENDKRYICNECGMRYVRKEALISHINWTHLKTLEHQCNLCSKLFKTDRQLRRHTSYVHEKKRPPANKICDYCGRAFTTQSILQCHIRTHTGERPLQCKSCPATFAHSAALYTHNKLLHRPANT